MHMRRYLPDSIVLMVTSMLMLEMMEIVGGMWFIRLIKEIDIYGQICLFDLTGNKVFQEYTTRHDCHKWGGVKPS